MSYTRLNDAPPLVLNPGILEGGKQPSCPPGPGYPSQDGDGYSQLMENFPPAPMTNQPKAGMGYPPLDSNQPDASILQASTFEISMSEKYRCFSGDGTWMPLPTGIPVCPPGLEYLTRIDELIINKKVEQTKAGEIRKTYTIKNSLGQKIYTTKEDTHCCTRTCCGNDRPFEMKIKDNAGNEVIHLVRELACASCLCPCCLQKLEVTSPPGVPCGRVVQEWSILATKYRVENESGEKVLTITGPFSTFPSNGYVELEVLSTDGVKVGKITKQWSTKPSKRAFQNADNFGITFLVDLDVKVKATLLGALLLIDYMFYKRKESNKNECVEGCCAFVGGCLQFM